MSLLRADLLQGRRIALAGDPVAKLSAALASLGAEVVPVPLDRLGEDEERVGEWARGEAPLAALVYQAAATFGRGGDAALRATLDEAWTAVREVAVGALIEAEAGKVVLLAPRAGAGSLAGAAAAGLENLARTLSVEWARHRVTAVLVARGEASETELATLIAFLVSEAGEYLSGCRVELGAAR